MDDFFLQLTQTNKTIKIEKSCNIKQLRPKMALLETGVIIGLVCLVALLILYILYINCMKSSNQRFHSKVTDRKDMFEETSSICFSSTAAGLDDHPIRSSRSNLSTLNRNPQSTLAEDGLAENVVSEYAEPIMLTKEDIEKRLKNSKNYENHEVNPSNNAPVYQNCGQFGDGSDVKYQNYPLGGAMTIDIHDIGKNKQRDGAVSTESLKHAKSGIIYANSTQNMSQKSPGSMSSSQYPMTQHMNEQQPESSKHSSNYDSSTTRSVKTAEIGRKTVKYTNISRLPTNDSDQNQSQLQKQAMPDGQPSSVTPINPRVQVYSTQTSTSSTGSLRRPKNIPNLQKSKFFDNINQKLQVITPRDTKTFEFPAPSSSGMSQKGTQNKKTSKNAFKSIGVHQSSTVPAYDNPKSPGSVSLSPKSFNIDKSVQQLPDLPRSISTTSNTGKFSPKTSSAFSLKLPGSGNEQQSYNKSPVSDGAPKLPNRSYLSLKSSDNRESINVDYCVPLSELNGVQLYSEPYSPSKK
ncbi:uncharacterized protein [Chironomus tepperi]|uniref:uncharacterized protein n=1 Tax=Chironomus tepperi TaxID=113505 RepID=UPI00391F6368